MEAQATAKYIRSSARKARLLADAIRGKMVGDALQVLQFGVKKAVAEDMTKVVKSAVANLQNKNENTAVDVDDLRVSRIAVDDGPSFGRYRARAQGRVGRIIKRMCHISVTVSN